MSLENLSLEARDELAGLAQTLAENPDTRKDFLRMTRRVKPGMPIPELDIEDHTNRAISASDSRVQALEAKLRERDAIEELTKRRNSLVRKGLVKENEIDEVEKLMLQKGINNHESAAEYFEFMRQAAKPTPTGYNPSAVKNLNLGAFWKDPKGAARNEAAAALADVRRPIRPIGL
jgi:multidrug resistance efflux pump